VALAAVAATARAQTAKPTFEVASVKRNVSGAPGPGGGPTETSSLRPGGAFTATNTTLQRLILGYFGGPAGITREDQLIGGPAWIRTARFDINAKAASDVPRDQIVLMVQSMLEERFRLVIDRGQVERDVYVLTRAHSRERLGPDIYPATDCPGPLAPGERRSPGDTIARIRNSPRPSSGAQLSFGGNCSTMDGLAGALQRTLGTTVLNKTGIEGQWNFAVAHSSQLSATAADNRPNLFVAVEEQLGLKLERTRGWVDILIIDDVREPTED
jgi:uncharacterized protein (TIGR03435 family)